MPGALHIPMPLRVPELAPSLGRLIVPRRLDEPWVPLDDVRERLATDVLLHGGRARQAAEDTRDEALDALAAGHWREAWEGAVRRVAERVTEALDVEIELAARRVRTPVRRWRRRLVSGAERRAIAARLTVGGGPFIAALEGIEAAIPRLRDATVTDHDALRDWQEALKAAARRLEAAWLALEDAVAAERVRWEPELADVAAWRPAVWPVVAAWLPLAAALVWLGMVLGGYLDAPAWLAELLGF